MKNRFLNLFILKKQYKSSVSIIDIIKIPIGLLSLKLYKINLIKNELIIVETIKKEKTIANDNNIITIVYNKSFLVIYARTKQFINKQTILLITKLKTVSKIEYKIAFKILNIAILIFLLVVIFL